MSSPRRRLTLPLILLLVLFSHLLEAAVFNGRKDPKGHLQVRLDYDLASKGGAEDSSHTWMFSSYLVFNEPVSAITDEQLLQIATNANVEMAADIEQYNPTKSNGVIEALPRLMTIMAFDNEIILASSQRGHAKILDRFPQDEMDMALDTCAREWETNPDRDTSVPLDPNHKNQRSCGEISAFYLYYQIHRKKIADFSPKIRVTSVFRHNSGTLGILEPCGVDRETKKPSKLFYGCNALIAQVDAGARYLNKPLSRQGYNLKKLAGGVKRIGQIKTCSKDDVIWGV